MQGTPKTLTEAINNGVEAFEKDRRASTQEECIEHIRKHIADFVRNGISPAVLANENKDVSKAIDVFINRLV